MKENNEQTTEGINSPSLPDIKIDNSEVSQKLDLILTEIINARNERAKEKEQQQKEQKKLELEQQKLQEEQKKIEEENLQKEEKFLNDISILTQNTDIEHQVEQTELLIEKLEEQILMQKFNVTFSCVIIATLLVMIFANSFKK